jgi:hypothetical protein
MAQPVEGSPRIGNLLGKLRQHFGFRLFRPGQAPGNQSNPGRSRRRCDYADGIRQESMLSVAGSGNERGAATPGGRIRGKSQLS